MHKFIVPIIIISIIMYDYIFLDNMHCHIRPSYALCQDNISLALYNNNCIAYVILWTLFSCENKSQYHYYCHLVVKWRLDAGLIEFCKNEMGKNLTFAISDQTFSSIESELNNKNYHVNRNLTAVLAVLR